MHISELKKLIRFGRALTWIKLQKQIPDYSFMSLDEHPYRKSEPHPTFTELIFLFF